ASTPSTHRRTKPRSATEPTWPVNGDGAMSTPTTSWLVFRSVRTSASPRCPALPVTRIFMLLLHSRATERPTYRPGPRGTDVALRTAHKSRGRIWCSARLLPATDHVCARGSRKDQHALSDPVPGRTCSCEISAPLHRALRRRHVSGSSLAHRDPVA